MSPVRRFPSLARVLLMDPLAVLAGLTLVTGWVLAAFVDGLGYIPLYFGRLLFSPEDVRAFHFTLLTVNTLALPTLWWRVRKFRAILRRGVPVKGQISRITKALGRYRLDFLYWYQGQHFQSRLLVRPTRRLGPDAPLQSGVTVTVIVDHARPTQALIQELYE